MSVEATISRASYRLVFVACCVAHRRCSENFSARPGPIRCILSLWVSLCLFAAFAAPFVNAPRPSPFVPRSVPSSLSLSPLSRAGTTHVRVSIAPPPILVRTRVRPLRPATCARCAALRVLRLACSCIFAVGASIPTVNMIVITFNSLYSILLFHPFPHLIPSRCIRLTAS